MEQPARPPPRAPPASRPPRRDLDALDSGPVHVLLYTWPTCSFCAEAKRLLGEAGQAFEERALDPRGGDRRTLARLEKLFDQATMPYVLVDGEPLGGLPELRELLGGAGEPRESSGTAGADAAQPEDQSV